MSDRPEDLFRAHGGQLRMSEALRLGMSRYMLYSLRDRGIIEPVCRGVYRLVDLPPITNPDLVTVGLRFPGAVVCLVSALAFHELTTQIPHVISVAVPRGARLPVLASPPVQAHRFSAAAYAAGIQEHRLDRVPVKVYGPEKTLADCFKFRHKIGMDVTLEALKLYRTRRKFDGAALLAYARICRVEAVMRPYLEATV